MKNRIKRAAIILVIVIPTYLLAYLVNSFFGGYWPFPVAGDLVFPDSGVPLHTAFMWQPYWGYVDHYNASMVGYVFYPAISCDRLWFHRTLDMASDQKILSGTNCSNLKWHPIGVKISLENEKLEAVRVAKMIKSPEYCLDQAKEGRSRDRHLIALLLFDHFGPEALEMLAAKAANTKNEREAEAYNRINDEVFSIEKNFYRQLKTQGAVFQQADNGLTNQANTVQVK